MVKIFITLLAKEDLKNIKTFIQKDSYQNSIKVIKAVLEKFRFLKNILRLGK